MKKIKLLLTLTAFFAVAALFAGNVKTKFNVNMHCEACQKKIEKNIAFEKGVKAMDVDLKTNSVVLTYDDKKTNPEKLIAGFKKIGYVATVAKADGCCSQNKTTGCAKEGESGCKENHMQGGEKKCCSQTATSDKKCCPGENAKETDKKCCSETGKPCEKSATNDKAKSCCSATKEVSTAKKCCSEEK